MHRSYLRDFEINLKIQTPTIIKTENKPSPIATSAISETESAKSKILFTLFLKFVIELVAVVVGDVIVVVVVVVVVVNILVAVIVFVVVVVVVVVGTDWETADFEEAVDLSVKQKKLLNNH